MNKNSDGVTAGDVVCLALCIIGVLTGLTGIVMTTPSIGVLGLLILLLGLAYFGILQAVDA